MNAGTRTDVVALAMALLPALVWFAIYFAWPNPTRHIPAEVAWVFRAILLAGVALCAAAIVLVAVRIRVQGVTLGGVLAIVAALGFLYWATPLTWGVLEAIFGSRAV